jgi:hypothetical protein
MGNRQNLSPARNQKTTTELTAIFQLSRSQSEDFTEKKLRGQILAQVEQSQMPLFQVW